jgi:CheY-like chemotaxis protein
MEINLPKFSAYGTLNTLFDDLHTARIPVVTLSANAKPRDTEK